MELAEESRLCSGMREYERPHTEEKRGTVRKQNLR